MITRSVRGRQHSAVDAPRRRSRRNGGAGERRADLAVVGPDPIARLSAQSPAAWIRAVFAAAG